MIVTTANEFQRKTGIYCTSYLAFFLSFLTPKGALAGTAVLCSTAVTGITPGSKEQTTAWLGNVPQAKLSPPYCAAQYWQPSEPRYAQYVASSISHRVSEGSLHLDPQITIKHCKCNLQSGWLWKIDFFSATKYHDKYTLLFKCSGFLFINPFIQRRCSTYTKIKHISNGTNDVSFK